jgi:3-hydroxybutyryl-CoA dehydrogenase
MDIHTVCVIGAGTMGTGIAQVVAQAGPGVHLIEASAEAIERSRRRLEKSLQGGIERGKLSPEAAQHVRERITWQTTFDSLADADCVIEAVLEDLEVKRAVWAEVDRRAPVGALLASNTSTLPIGTLAECSGRPERFLGMHFFNPPPAMKLVEVIPHAATLPEVREAAVALCEHLGKTPLVAPDIPGFIVNRALGALVAAALDVWDQGGQPETIDAALELGLGHKMGPLRTADLVGLDIILTMLDLLVAQTNDPRFRATDRLRQLVADGKLGAKASAGIYHYGE